MKRMMDFHNITHEVVVDGDAKRGQKSLPSPRTWARQNPQHHITILPGGDTFQCGLCRDSYPVHRKLSCKYPKHHCETNKGHIKNLARRGAMELAAWHIQSVLC